MRYPVTLLRGSFARVFLSAFAVVIVSTEKMTSTHIQIPIQTTSPIRCGAGSKCGAGSMNSWPGKWYGPVLKSTFAHHAVRCDLSLAGS